MARKSRHIFVLVILLSGIMVFSLFGYYRNIHTKVAEMALEVLKRGDTNRLYQEIYSQEYSEKILLGSWQEDEGAIGGHDRSFRHYWDPEKNVGVPWFSYYLVMPYVSPGSEAGTTENPLITYARGKVESHLPGDWRWHYPSALEWARNSAGSGDTNNWEGAIEAYSYTPSSRVEAFWRLGHVVHLVADMAEPDHAANVPHAASGFYYPKDLKKISRLIENSKPDIAKDPRLIQVMNRLKRLLELKSWDEKRTVGFEELIDQNTDKIFPDVPAVKKNKQDMFDSYLSVMAKLSLSAIKEGSGYPLPLGVSFLPERDQSKLLLINYRWVNWSFFPSIQLSDPNECRKFVSLARNLLMSAVRLNTGLLEFFHDIVNPPPYVRSVELRQENKPRYHAWWEDAMEERTGRHVKEIEVQNKEKNKKTKEISYEDSSYKVVVGRTLKHNSQLPGFLKPDKATTVRILFGPDPKEFDATPEKIKTAWVKIDNVKIQGQLTDGGTAWVGRFTPKLADGELEKKLPIEIFAKDIHNHKANRITYSSQDEVHGDKEYQLDSEPEFPAKATSTPPYDWQHYRPGTDWQNHSVMVMHGVAYDIDKWWKADESWYNAGKNFRSALPGFKELQTTYVGAKSKAVGFESIWSRMRSTEQRTQWGLSVKVIPYRTDSEVKNDWEFHRKEWVGSRTKPKSLQKETITDEGRIQDYKNTNNEGITTYTRQMSIFYKNCQISIHEAHAPSFGEMRSDAVLASAKALIDRKREETKIVLTR